MKFNVRNFALAMGFSSVILFSITKFFKWIMYLIFGQWMPLGMWKMRVPGMGFGRMPYGMTLGGFVWCFVMAFVGAFIFGWLFAWIFNKLEK